MRRFARTLIELLHLVVGLLAVAVVTETAAWAYPLGRDPIAWIGRVIAVGVLVWSVPKFVEAWGQDSEATRAHG